MNGPLVLEETDTLLTHRLRIEVQGVVQGVGFRPFVYSLATRFGLSGFVGNDSHGVFIEVEGEESALNDFQAALIENVPPLAHIEVLQSKTIPVQHSTGFEIVHSQDQRGERTLISPDLCICDDCLAELFDPNNRRYRYPFINCTNCGPRFTITRDIPYDRPLTTMAKFAMCPACRSEYENPLDRRFHAQPNACPVCGPQVELRIAAGAPLGRGLRITDDVIQATQKLLVDGKIVAVKGIGGFHLACDATNDQAVQLLRQRKGRVDKPFALMVRDLASVRTFAEVNEKEAALLISRQRPIVLLRKRDDFALSHWIAPGNHYIGVMLPYTPLHYLLLDTGNEIADSLPLLPPPSSLILVMTSGNLSDEPIVKENDEALEKLAGLVDAILLHHRPIHVRCDDSVMRVLPEESHTQSPCHPVTFSSCHLLPIRRSRGYAPFPIKLPFTVPSILAVGGELKSTFCLTVDEHAFMSQHIGDMGNLETLEAFSESVTHFQSIFRTEPRLIACDLHPGYLSAKWAKENAQGVPVIEVQHHHAHIAALMAEHGLDGSTPVIGFSFDGTGYGTDGTIWGGEVLSADYCGFERVAHLKKIPLPGGDAAIKRPYRQALAHLWAAHVEWDERIPSVAASIDSERKVLLRQFESSFNTVATSSMGRLFDAVASLIGVRQTVTYEGQAAIEMEAIATTKSEAGYHFTIEAGTPIIIDAAPVIRSIVEDVLQGMAAETISARFHYAVAALILQLAQQIRNQRKIETVALSGGVFQNVTLLSLATEFLQNDGFTVLTHHLVPPNDGGLALGQAVVAAFSRTVNQ
ncbi:MAG: carbamoyltransferase HypF [Caldilineaceae bacterium]